MKNLKTKITTIKLLAVLCIAVAFFSCSGEDGDMGPAGEQGIAGTNGTNGTNGTDGDDGEDGNANVVSFKFDITAASGTSHQLNNTTAKTFVEDGAVLAYVRVADTWYQVPNQRIFTNGFSIIDIASEFVPNGNSYLFKLNFVRNGAPITISAGDLDELRLVLISTSNSTSRKSSNKHILDSLYKKGVAPTDYYQVLEYFNLKE